MEKNETVGKIERLIDPILTQKNLELVDLEYKSEGKGKVVRIYIDKEGGVNIDDCSAVSRELSVVMDVHDVINGPYNLEISSPGLTRQLKKERDFTKNIGKKLKIKLNNPVNKQYVLRNALLESFENSTLGIDYEGSKYEIALEDVSKANLELDF
ncbi:MAG: ribosome maturation factor RimP [Candidatus Dadabacteria bacterium]|nr:ribosome maturation factor RimP [Candidatus Dadabacteria bacterium]NIS09753.1 ribosome maturation factor RimP [Candidatus Dadabacteria bacterium]NIV41118.1 ribosome maturation factor [Candidatus Dadabacteria bacterium]NIX16211.1 ribosome maturation factor [Candidatus Dadabacteria bacterium]NIY22834.1 ribosome maturation factor [Candidatus Dadabacteria bacterium]